MKKDCPISYLAFGNESQAHYRVPVNSRNAYVLLAQPKELTEELQAAFDRVLADVQPKLQEVLSTMPEYDDQPHVEPQLRVFMPGTYNRVGDPKRPTETCSEFRTYFSYGSHKGEVVTDGPASVETTQAAVRELLASLGANFDDANIVETDAAVRVGT